MNKQKDNNEGGMFFVVLDAKCFSKNKFFLVLLFCDITQADKQAGVEAWCFRVPVKTWSVDENSVSVHCYTFHSCRAVLVAG